jgi:hypothetical protein
MYLWWHMERNVGPSRFLEQTYLNVSYVSIHRRSVVLPVLSLYILVHTYTHTCIFIFTKKTKNSGTIVTAVLLKIQCFWDVWVFKIFDCLTLKMVIRSFETSGTTCPKIHSHIPEDVNIKNIQCCTVYITIILPILVVCIHSQSSIAVIHIVNFSAFIFVGETTPSPPARVLACDRQYNAQEVWWNNRCGDSHISLPKFGPQLPAELTFCYKLPIYLFL